MPRPDQFYDPEYTRIQKDEDLRRSAELAVSKGLGRQTPDLDNPNLDIDYFQKLTRGELLAAPKVRQELSDRARFDVMAQDKALGDAAAAGDKQAEALLDLAARRRYKDLVDEHVAKDAQSRLDMHLSEAKKQAEYYADAAQKGVNITKAEVFETPEQVKARTGRQFIHLTPSQAAFTQEKAGAVTPETAEFWKLNRDRLTTPRGFEQVAAAAKTPAEQKLIAAVRAEMTEPRVGLPSDAGPIMKYLQAGARFAGGAVGGAADAARRMADTQTDTQTGLEVGGVDLPKFGAALAEHPLASLDKLMTGASQGAIKGVQEGEGTASGIAGSTIRALNHYRKEASPSVDEAMQRIQAEDTAAGRTRTPEEYEKQRAQLTQTAVDFLATNKDLGGRVTKWALNHPKGFEDLVGIPLDVYWVMTPAKLASMAGSAVKGSEALMGAGKAISEAVAGTKVGQYGQAAKDIFTYMPEAGKLEKKMGIEGLGADFRGAVDLAKGTEATALKAGKSAKEAQELGHAAAMAASDEVAAKYGIPREAYEFVSKRIQGKDGPKINLGPTLEKIWEGTKKAADYTVTPVNQIFRETTTLASPAYQASNIVSAPQLQYVGMGLGVANKDAQVVAAQLFKSAFKDLAPEALAKELPMANGKTVTMGELKDLFEKYHLSGQGMERIGTDYGKGRLADVAKGVAKFNEKVGATALNEGVSNYQKAVPFVDYILRHGDLSHHGISQAVQYASDVAGNYDRISQGAGYLGKVINFVPWTEFIIKNNVSFALKHPARMAQFAKQNQAVSDLRGEGDTRPRILGQALSDRDKLKYVASPQNQKLLGMDEKALMMEMHEQPMNTLLQLTGTSPMKSGALSDAKAFWQAAGAMLGYNLQTGEEIGGWKERMRTAGLAPVPRLAASVVNGIKNIVSGGDLETAADMILQIRANADFPVASRAMDLAAGHKQLPLTAPDVKSVSRVTPNYGQTFDAVGDIAAEEKSRKNFLKGRQ